MGEDVKNSKYIFHPKPSGEYSTAHNPKNAVGLHRMCNDFIDMNVDNIYFQYLIYFFFFNRFQSEIETHILGKY